MADHEITNDTYADLDPDETKEWSLRDFMAAMMQSNACAVIKFWSLIAAMPDDQLRPAAKVFISDLMKGQDGAQILRDIRQADEDAGTHTDLTNCF